MFKCSACGRNLDAAIKLLGEREVVDAHIRAHMRDDLNTAQEAIENAWLFARAELAETVEGSVVHNSLINVTGLCKKALDRVNTIITMGQSITFSKE